MEKITIRDPKQFLESHPLTLQVEALSQVSDGYHTIAELYDHRITLFIALCRALVEHGKPGTIISVGGVWRSKIHSDGKPAYEGWFIMGIGKEKGSQISYHIPLERWDETDFADTLEQAPPFDGHTSSDVLERLKAL